MHISNFDKYIIKTDRSEYDLAKYIRERLDLSLRDDMKPFWRNLDPLLSNRDQAAETLRDYILKCYEITEIADTNDYGSEIVNFIGCDFGSDFNLDFCGGVYSY